MWRRHTMSALIVSIIALTVPPLLASGQKQSNVPVNCPNDITIRKIPKPSQQDSSAIRAYSSVSRTNSTLDGAVEVSSDITTNQIWTANNTYHITATINVQALLVIEPGTIIEFAADIAMVVNNGGALISAGTPDNPIIYTSDSATPEYSDYSCAIRVEETASASTKITYNTIEYAEVGIWVLNKRLDSPIENNYFYNNSFGILEYGIEHTDIYNNLIYASYYNGIEINMESYEGLASADSHILIQNNTCDYYQDVGIAVFGVDNEADAGEVTLTNNIVSGAYQCGLVLANGWFITTVSNTGYYDNVLNKNWEFEEYNPVIETALPYADGTGTLPVCYLNPNSTFVNASDEYIEQTRLIGKTTDINSFPDSNLADLGFHYPNWQFSNAGASSLTADFDNSLAVDFNDLLRFADYWLYDYDEGYSCWWWDRVNDGVIDFNDLDVIANNWLTEYDFEDFSDFAKYWQKQVDYRFQDRRFDIVADNLVDFKDYSMFANQWGQETTSSDPNIQIQISGDPNNGYVDVGVSGWTPDTRRIFLLADGKYVGEIFRFKDSMPLTIDISKLGAGIQKFKVVSVDDSGHITCSHITNFMFSRPLYYCFLPEIYKPNQPLPFAAYNPGAGDISVKVYANGGNLVWSQDFSGNTVLGSIPATITNSYEIDYVSFDDSSEGSLVKKVTDPAESPISEPVRALIIVPNWKFRLYDFQTIWTIQDALKRKGVVYAKLSGGNATYDKIAWYARNKDIKYLYIGCTDGNRWLDEDDGIFRTVVYLTDGATVSIKRSDYSNPNDAPPWCVALKGDDEKNIKSFASMGFNYLEFAYFDICYSGRLKINENDELVQGERGEVYDFDAPHSDMSFALGMGETSISRFYQGWYDVAWVDFFPEETEYQRWSQLEWTYLGMGENLYWALYYTIEQQTEFGPDDPANNYILRGQGSLMDIELRSW